MDGGEERPLWIGSRVLPVPRMRSTIALLTEGPGPRRGSEAVVLFFGGGQKGNVPFHNVCHVCFL